MDFGGMVRENKWDYLYQASSLGHWSLPLSGKGKIGGTVFSSERGWGFILGH